MDAKVFVDGKDIADTVTEVANGAVENMKEKAKKLWEKPIPLGKTVLICLGVVVLTAAFSGKNKTIINNIYRTGGCL